MNTMDAIGLQRIWNQIRRKLQNHKIQTIDVAEIQEFFKIQKNGVHKSLIR
jgi:hypothetical protein